MDLYRIPNDDGKTYRLKKFVEYQHEVPSIHYRFLGEYIKTQEYTKDRTVDMCWLMSVTYNEITCLVLDYLLNGKNMNHKQLWDVYKEKLDFGSARKYAKNCDWFVPLMEEWKHETIGEPYKWILKQRRKTGEQTYIHLQKKLQGMRFVGRFAADLFIESVSYLSDYLGVKIREPSTVEWENGSNLTSGLFNIFYEDEKAQDYEKTKTVSFEDKILLSEYLRIVQQEIQRTYPNQDSEITMFIGKICSFRNLFKAARYGGFHHDRQLGVIKKYERELPQFQNLYHKSYALRSKMFPRKFLGEFGGWNGIRKERKKLWLKKGLTGVEDWS